MLGGSFYRGWQLEGAHGIGDVGYDVGRLWMAMVYLCVPPCGALLEKFENI